VSTFYLAFNTERAPLSSVHVRRGIAEALNREALLKDLLPTSRATTQLLPSTIPLSANDEELKRLPSFDLEAARAELSAAGGVHRPLRLVYSFKDSFLPEVAIAERVRDALAKVGVEVELEPRSDFASEIARVAPDGFRAHDMYLKRLGGDYAHPNTFFAF